MAMPTDQAVQGAVWNVELGRGKTVLQWVVVVAAAAVLSLVYTSIQFKGLEKREAMDMAQLAHNISRGQGFTTSVIRPMSLWHLRTYRSDHDQMFENHPDLYNPPLYPLVLAGMFRLLPAKIFDAKLSDILYAPERWIILPFNQVCLLLSLLLVYHWAKGLFDRRVAIMAGLILLFSDTLWSYGISGLPTTFLQLLLLAAMYCLFLLDQRMNPPDGNTPRAALSTGTIGLIVASAVLMGMCFLTRYLTLFLVIPMAWYVGRAMRGRGAAIWAAIYLAIVVAVIAPWLVRNFRLSHSLLGIARYQIFETESFDRTYQIVLKDSWSARGIAGRFLTNLRSYWLDSFRTIGTDICIFFFAVSMMYSFRRTDVSRLRLFILGSLGVALAGMALIGMPGESVNPAVNGGNLLVLLLPLVAIYGCAFFYLLLDRIDFSMKLTRGLAIGAFVVLNIAPMIFVLLPPRRGAYPYPPYCPPYMRLVAKWFGKSEVGVSDLPWSVAWYMDRTALWLPSTPEEYFEIHDFVAPHSTQFAIFTPYMLDRHYQSDLTKGEYKPWAGILRGQLDAKFPLKTATLLGPDNDQILLTDRPRWKDKEETDLKAAATQEANPGAVPKKQLVEPPAKP
jgi:4-amino-4-deoxy-L-arabinose transferase-like glycosyltransferase